MRIQWPSADLRSVSAGQWLVQATREHEAEVVLVDAGIGGVSTEAMATLRQTGVATIVLAWDEREIIRDKALTEADDYVLKPFCSLELVARLEVALQRAGERDENLDDLLMAGQPRTFDDGVLSLDFSERRALVHQRPVFLTVTEFDLLAQLMRCRGFVVPSRTLLERTCGGESDEQTEYLSIHMRRLRDKLEPNPDNPRYVLSERGVGYRFARAYRPARTAS
ncbi:MAG TPA: winged helix-turn-helix domain-containing protein [Chloroflexota bacterium]|nr:winged helix-turn-helix domain-containing protein [Chloroflexota bacterium]